MVRLKDLLAAVGDEAEEVDVGRQLLCRLNIDPGSSLASCDTALDGPRYSIGHVAFLIR